MSKRLTQDEFLMKACAVHGDEYDYSEFVCQGVKNKSVIICKRHGRFEQSPESHLKGYGCPVCAVEKRKNTMLGRYGVASPMRSGAILAKSRATRQERFGRQRPPGSGRRALGRDTFIERARAIHGDRYDYSMVEYVNNSTRVRIVCPAHGVFEQTPAKHLKGRGCPDMECINARREATSMSHFGVKNPMQAPVVIDALRDANLARFGVPNPMQRSDVKEKQVARNLEKYGVRCTLELESVKAQGIETKRRNQSFGKSESEDILYARLCGFFGPGDVVRQYKSESYPFACDFYIKSRDLYIELNAYWSHGGYWFDSASVEDADVVAVWRNRLASGKPQYENALDTWTVRDAEKRETARRNDLNYVVFWDNQLRDADVWFELNCPDGRDWDEPWSWFE